jgi:hypothetical protein
MSTSIDTLSQQNLKVSNAAQGLNFIQRQTIGIQALKGNTSISQLANENAVSRKFVYSQKEKALSGIKQAFKEQTPTDENEVLFYIPVTKKWISQVVLALILICKASYQNVCEFLIDVMDYKMCKGTVHNIVYEHLSHVKEINCSQDLSTIKQGLHDEIYQSGTPVLVGCCASSTYCYLLKSEEACDATTWGVHLIDLQEKQKLSPDFTVLDGGASARKGQIDAWPEIPAHGDVFHALKPFLEAVNYLGNRAKESIKKVEEIRHKIQHPRGKWKTPENQEMLRLKLADAEQDEQKIILLWDELSTLYRWVKDDILALVGPSYIARKELLQFVIDHLHMRESLYQHKIKPVRTYLENHSTNLLEFVPIMEQHFKDISEELNVPLSDVLAIYHTKGLPFLSQKRWQREAILRDHLKGKFYILELEVNKVLDTTVRANSLVENINSRLRNYFTLRRDVGNDYLALLQFFLNHRRFMRSEYPARVNKSPAELMTGEKHSHWLEMLGFKRFKRAA